MPTYPFSSDELILAHVEWGCNCGPSSLSFALQRPLEHVRHAIPRFHERHYTNPPMMRSALAFFKQRYAELRVRNASLKNLLFDRWPSLSMSLVRIQWTGPWTVAGARAGWAARQSHWIAVWSERSVCLAFDCNAGIQSASEWESQTVPKITQDIDRADGGWFPTHIWQLIQPSP